MKRFHVHLHFNNIKQNIAFYSAMFNQPPARAEADYAKWMLQDPPLNFAISTRGQTPGVDHLGIQVESADDLAALKANAQRADMALLNEGETTCCYAHSDKYWLADPQGVAWEHFHTRGSIPVFSARKSTLNQLQTNTCCTSNATTNIETESSGTCCTPAASSGKACC